MSGRNAKQGSPSPAGTGTESAQKKSSNDAPHSTPKRKPEKLGSAAVPLRNAVADSIADRFVNLANEILDEMRTTDTLSPVTLLAGESLAMLALFQTMPEPRPESIELLEIALMNYLLHFNVEAA